ncbi:uncharacterized protein ATNIH1004_000061 [Aspergillus tanneri]|uniref:Uncharacterized protein n=1 Tax=Aspergillus tanneri TaxID=1220188 RepID=A0A5M9N1Z7_9EURO|nr:uncharacterized protein ATNIH1004_000061 [Aspergillus tanneri]KAA8651183.1 hypothetical protein ATNIH1004_000061 [Aspergillus tanneri]
MTGEDCMIQAYDPEEKILDYQAVCQFAKLLLQLDTADRPATTLQPESEDFANARLGTTVEELLNRRVGYHSLQPFPIVLRILHSGL